MAWTIHFSGQFEAGATSLSPQKVESEFVVYTAGLHWADRSPPTLPRFHPTTLRSCAQLRSAQRMKHSCAHLLCLARPPVLTRQSNSVCRAPAKRCAADIRTIYAWPLPPVSESPGSPSPVRSSPGLASSAVSAGASSIRLPIICKRACCSGPYPLARKSPSSI